MRERPVICVCTCGGRHCASNRISIKATRNLPPMSAETVAAAHENTRAREKTVQAETVPGAERRYRRWASEEIDQLMDRSLTNEELANRLGRTYEGVKSKRKKVAITYPKEHSRGDSEKC